MNKYLVQMWDCKRKCYTDFVREGVKAESHEDACHIVEMDLDWGLIEDADNFELEATIQEWGELYAR